MPAPEMSTSMSLLYCVRRTLLVLCTVETVRADGKGMTTDYLWGGRSGATRGPKPALSLERIAAAAIAIADAEGLAAVSMQRVAADLGYTQMSLYRYLPGKAELVALMGDRGIREPPVLNGAHWPAGLKEGAHRLLAE